MTQSGYELLRGVSRSFYLSIRALPRALREPVALAYLLARTSDTVADSEVIQKERRVELLDEYARAIAGSASAADVAQKIAETAFGPFDVSGSRPRSALPSASAAAEEVLLRSAETFLRELAAIAAADRADIHALLLTIVRGQRLDLTRWSAGFAALANANELREYTFLVAGCVGEFWTRVCFRKLPGFTARGETEMLELGRKYGSGLQLINILRDAGEDLRSGRCYFPEDELRGAGLTPAEVPAAPKEFLPIYQRWIAEARDGLDAGLDYCIAINPPRVRLATVLPALIGARTLELLEQSGLAALRERIKVPRAEVRKMIASATVTLANRTRLRSLRARL
ncbi:MAG: squalene/phytoene synthase family protein [Verrucomicrobia bacterium]|nr:squalene/phytoene synthase family protein [Verrucomicrobiota bacterium]